ncbi:Flp family type IVb pilin [Halodesulfovibrio aestuarii]|uniref:Flp pilus assembly protein, pilin Flp n=1 Tax=Halodesulfovibrio aestuarii TaxID=126333 RepID=A0A8G2FAM7_9BACT|nr:Flp family type IVb pilin [Halodesulfovibrio aestuarii]SHI81001.1 Flp pilus assembly protein, pilin Flp [Halodesulfovibrio aestuarii]
MVNAIKKFTMQKRGASAVEYGILIALVAVAFIGGANLLASHLDSKFSAVANELSTTQSDNGSDAATATDNAANNNSGNSDKKNKKGKKDK